MIKLHGVVAVVVPAVTTCRIVVDDSRSRWIGNKGQYILGYLADAIGWDDIARKWISGESPVTVGSSAARIVDLD